MSISLLSFFGIQCVSLALAAAILFEYLRLSKRRTQLFERLGDAKTPRRRYMQYFLIVLYLATTLLIAGVSSYVFFL
jgi:hypothetical protein